MSFSAIIILSFAMSMDAFAAAISKGATLCKPHFREAIRTGIIFGSIETITPIIGWFLGIATSHFIMDWDHWVAFTLLFILGCRMIYLGWESDGDEEAKETVRYHSFFSLATTAIATSLDALTVGVGLAFLQVNIVHTALTIGIVTMLMATLGIIIGRFIGSMLGNRAEIFGGLVLIVIGVTILVEHLHLLN